MEKRLGPCCICGNEKDVVVIVPLNKKSPIPGRGWGCFQCNQAPDGAVAVVCRTCEKKLASGEAELKYACRGYPGVDGRVPISELKGIHEHNIRLHPELHRMN